MCCVAKFVLPANKAAAFKLKIPSLSPALGPNHCQPHSSLWQHFALIVSVVSVKGLQLPQTSALNLKWTNSGLNLATLNKIYIVFSCVRSVDSSLLSRNHRCSGKWLSPRPQQQPRRKMNPFIVKLWFLLFSYRGELVFTAVVSKTIVKISFYILNPAPHLHCATFCMTVPECCVGRSPIYSKGLFHCLHS